MITVSAFVFNKKDKGNIMLLYDEYNVKTPAVAIKRFKKALKKTDWKVFTEYEIGGKNVKTKRVYDSIKM